MFTSTYSRGLHVIGRVGTAAVAIGLSRVLSPLELCQPTLFRVLWPIDGWPQHAGQKVPVAEIRIVVTLPLQLALAALL